LLLNVRKFSPRKEDKLVRNFPTDGLIAIGRGKERRIKIREYETKKHLAMTTFAIPLPESLQVPRGGHVKGDCPQRLSYPQAEVERLSRIQES